ncbi:hypothetical protein [Winslowiella iniecta]|uniref:Uncharacterized protein n=1 Tax=Winslowiella iniecta TaxID=1560201 RepID=A0A0L7T2L4_9GAMM|nr:hypothetical protein [Winslowiella iniecta]KOC88086.1 hypothetical protein NG42_17850 [Winslowiella iniecta]KOC89669.1 hypothetical protein NG43_18565 [Winslowiella iniecta]
MKYLLKVNLFTMLFLSSFTSLAETITTFNGRHFTIEIESQCDITAEDCENVRFHSVSLTNGGLLDLNGRTIKLSGDDNVFGYQFNHGEYIYRLSPDISSINYWYLTVLNQNKLVAEDSGVMK